MGFLEGARKRVASKAGGKQKKIHGVQSKHNKILLGFYENVHVYVQVMALMEKFKPYVKSYVIFKLLRQNQNPCFPTFKTSHQSGQEEEEIWLM